MSLQENLPVLVSLLNGDTIYLINFGYTWHETEGVGNTFLGESVNGSLITINIDSIAYIIQGENLHLYKASMLVPHKKVKGAYAPKQRVKKLH